MNSYTWVIESLDCIPSIDGQNNVVSNVHWRVNGADGTYNVSVYGTQGLIYVPGNPFTAYDSLTEATVIGWVKEAMGADSIASLQKTLDNKIANLVNPPIITPFLPWKK